MVRICSATEYPAENEAEFAAHFAAFPYPLSPFQKWTIEAILLGHHTLTCAHTGSGKTLGAEFAIRHFAGATGSENKVIYCSPIKALSNQKYKDFRDKFPDISIGLVTGDIKINADANVLIMTTEILMHHLCRGRGGVESASTFSINIAAEVACIVFDEVHYINDADRGHVWEQCLALLPAHIQIVMLSATLDGPETFAAWVESRAPAADPPKLVYLTATTHRIVPLTHYAFVATTAGLHKFVRGDDVAISRIKDTADSLQIIQNDRGEFQAACVDKIRGILRMLDVAQIRVSRQHVMNQLCKLLFERDMFPAICFVYSRRLIEIMAAEVETVLLADDSKTRYVVHRECEQILRRTFPGNFREYLELPEYAQLLRLLECGIAIHHAGMIAVLREIVEIMFAAGHVRLLFATETFSVGINMPTKTVIFSAICKPDGSGEAKRRLLPHEYGQQSGRAGRRGMDAVGHVIHLPNLWGGGHGNDDDIYSNASLATMMRGTPQRLDSKLRITYDLILTVFPEISHGGMWGDAAAIVDFLRGTMLQHSVDKQVAALEAEWERREVAADFAEMMHTATPEEVLLRVHEMESKMRHVPQKTRKLYAKELAVLATQWPGLHGDMNVYRFALEKQVELRKAAANVAAARGWIAAEVDKVVAVLLDEGLMTSRDESELSMTRRGFVAAMLRELPGGAFVSWFFGSAQQEGLVHKMVDWTAAEIVEFLSAFVGRVGSADESVQRIQAIAAADATAKRVEYAVYCMSLELDAWAAREHDCGVYGGGSAAILEEFHGHLVGPMAEWCAAEDEAACRGVLAMCPCSTGDFVKAVLKINNMAAELERVADYLCDMTLLQKLRDVPRLTLKYVCSAQSLYL